MKEISTKELKEKIRRKDNFKLIMTYYQWVYETKHIPGSIHVDSSDGVSNWLNVNDEVIVYCVNKNCPASATAYHQLVKQGFKNVRRYAAGLEGWEADGNHFSRGAMRST